MVPLIGCAAAGDTLPRHRNASFIPVPEQDVAATVYSWIDTVSFVCRPAGLHSLSGYSHHFIGGAIGIFTIEVSPDFVCPYLGRWGATDHHFIFVAQALVF